MQMTRRVPLLMLLMFAAAAMVAAAAHAAPPVAPVVPDLFFEGQQPAEPVYTDGEQVVDLSTAWSATGVKPGEQVVLAVVMKIKPHWHINVPNVIDPYKPTKLTNIDAPSGFVATTPIYPPATRVIDLFGEKVEVYEGDVVIYIPLAVADFVKPGEYTVTPSFIWQACLDNGICLPEVTVPIPATLNVVAASAAVEPANAELFAGYAAAAAAQSEALEIPFFGLDFTIDPRNLVVLWLIAALGGFLLNFTPCVLPLVPIKIMGLAQAAGTRRRTLLLGIVTFFGVTTFWVALGIVISTVAGFTSTNQLFQYPAFTITVGVVIALMALGMLGAYAFRLPQAVYLINPSHDTMHGSFLFGIMIAVLSTPCTAPAMGAAAAWAATQNPAITLSTFAAIGIGMAAPYLVLAAFPALVEKMPRTGPASELIKQVMGMLMLAAAAYFVGTGLSGVLVDPPDPPSRGYWWAVAAIVAAAGLWLAWRTVHITRCPGRLATFVALGLLIAASGIYIGVNFSRKGPVNWVYYTPQRLADAQQQGKVVVLEFTAEWCLNCKLLEEAVLNTDDVSSLLNSDEVAPVKVDLTGNNPVGNEKLLEVGRRTIPLLIVYDPQGREIFKSDAYTPEQVIDAIQQARAASVVGAK